MIDAELLSILCCPESRQDLTEGTEAQIASLNQVIADGKVKNRAGQMVSEKVDGVLIRADGLWAYLVRQEIPIMLIDEAIPWAELS